MSKKNNSIHEDALHALKLCDPQSKVEKVLEIEAAMANDQFTCATGPVYRIAIPGRPSAPELVPPMQVPRKRLSSLAGRIALLHSLAHIEFNAINLALDAVYRFRQLPRAYYADWWSVAADEARHFCLLQACLRSHGSEYGAMPAHNHLWQATYDTDFDPMVRMALVPRVLEARGLDVAPGIYAKLKEAGDEQAAAALKVIMTEEVNHVRIGNHWYLHFCSLRHLPPEETFRLLLCRFGAGYVAGPFNRPARIEAGFSAQELDDLDAMALEFKRSLK